MNEMVDPHRAPTDFLGTQLHSLRRARLNGGGQSLAPEMLFNLVVDFD